ncbi:MAG: hypothetical protein VYD18_00275 [Candidatus Latescibacterota bacterium]|nr:hypothetical protein [Candidatus Latescibacterota bacterium]
MVVEDTVIELAIAERHLAEKKRELAAARRAITADRGLIAEMERLSEDTINMIKSVIAEGQFRPPPTQ